MNGIMMKILIIIHVVALLMIVIIIIIIANNVKIKFVTFMKNYIKININEKIIKFLEMYYLFISSLVNYIENIYFILI